MRNLGSSWEKYESRLADYREYCCQLLNAFDEAFSVLESPSYTLCLPKALTIAELSFDHPLPGVCCGMGRNHLVIRNDGNLAGCPMTVSEQSSIPSDDLLASMRQFAPIPQTRDAASECLRCKWYRVCGGDCSITNSRLHGNMFAQSPLCPLWKGLIPRYLVFYGKKLEQANNLSSPSGADGCSVSRAFPVQGT